MSYDPTIAKVIFAKIHETNESHGTFYLPACQQQDVMDTVNYLRAQQPNVFAESEISYNGLADVTFDVSSWDPPIQ